MKVTQNCVCLTNPCINLLVPSSVTREYHPNILELLSALSLICYAHMLQFGFLERHNTSIFLVIILFPAWSQATENRSSACWRPCSEGGSSSKSCAESKWLILLLPTVTPSLCRGWNCLSSNSCRPGIPKLGYMHPSGYIFLSERVHLLCAVLTK